MAEPIPSKSWLLLISIASLPMIGILLPTPFAWGFNFLEFLSPLHSVFYGGAIVLLLVLGRIPSTARALDSALVWLAADRWRSLSLGVIGFVVLWIVHPVRVPILGDSWFILSNFSGVVRGTDIPIPRDEPLSVFLLAVVLELVKPQSLSELQSMFHGIGLVLGLSFVLIAWLLAETIIADARIRLLCFLNVCFNPATLLFFGYVETYAVVLLAVAGYILAGVRFLRGKTGYPVVILLFFAQLMCHYLTVLTIPSLVYLGAIGHRTGRRREIIKGMGVLLLLSFLVLLGIDFNPSGYYSAMPHAHYLPLTGGGGEAEVYSTPYTLLSPWHFVDLANSLLLLLPCAIFVSLSTVWVFKSSSNGVATDARGESVKFLLSAIILVAGFLAVAKFDAGMARDWDVVAPFVFIATFAAFVGWELRSGSPSAMIYPILFSGIFMAQSILWYQVNSSEDGSVRRFNGLLEDGRFIPQGAAYSGALYLSSYHASRDNHDSIRSSWNRYRLTWPNDGRAHLNILKSYSRSDSSEVFRLLASWVDDSSIGELVRRQIAEYCLGVGRYLGNSLNLAQADSFLIYSTMFDPTRPDAHRERGRLMWRRGDSGGAMGLVLKSLEAAPNDPEGLTLLGMIYFDIGERTLGIETLKRAASHGSREAIGTLRRLSGGKGQRGER